jgi:hypothetical protein
MMTLKTAARGAIREQTGTYTDPYLGQTLGEAKASASVTVRGRSVELKFGFPCADYAAELLPALQEPS